ncbi:MAG: flavohemoglobin expression-modulating QEGLA motif protein, partial [Deltaproteobacteria bacterium]
MIDPLFRAIRQLQTFGERDFLGIARVRVRRYLPMLCVTLHDGHDFPRKLETSCLLSDADRLFEEDPHTADLLRPLPILLAGRESRYYYDLNRSVAEAFPRIAFGRQVWAGDGHPDIRNALRRHRAFYRLAGTLLTILTRRFGHCLVIDLHSYNASKHDRPTPLFNLGTAALDIPSHRPLLDRVLEGLARIHLPGIETTVAENDVFQGRGHFVNWVSRCFPCALPLCLEVKKVYCDEHTGEPN